MNDIQKFSTKSIDAALGYVIDAVKIGECTTVNVFLGVRLNSQQFKSFMDFTRDPQTSGVVNVFKNTPLKTEGSELDGTEVLVQTMK